MAAKLEKMSPIQQKAVDAAVQEAVRKEMDSGRSFKADEFVAEKMKAITGSDMPGYYKQDHAAYVNEAASKYIKEIVDKHDKKRPAFGGEYMQLPTVPLQRTEDKGRLI